MVIWQLLWSTGKARVKEDWERKAEAGTWDLHLSGLTCVGKWRLIGSSKSNAGA